jgi:two-component system, NtrC family, response regulator
MAHRSRVLIVGGDEATRTRLADALSEEFEVTAAGDSVALTVDPVRRPAVSVLDLSPPEPSVGLDEGLRLLREIGRESHVGRMIVCANGNDRYSAVRAVQAGAYDVVTTPLDLDLLRLVVRRACWIAELERERPGPSDITNTDVEEMIGASDSIRKVFGAVRKVAASDVPVLITGESGTGKELAAKAIHRRSRRAGGPFVTINCGAIPETLLEAELFGHERGAFTGAVQQKKGKVEYADGGTLFLDEVGELPLGLQVKLLRFLQDKTIERIGGRRQITVDTRIIAATHVNLRQAIGRRAFREDLYYRLGVVDIPMPPLRQRGEDVILIAQACLRQASEGQGKRVQRFTRDALQAIRSHSWPGNVRELSNRIRRAVTMAEGPEITPEDLDLEHPEAGSPTGAASLKEARQRLEKALLVQALTLHRGNVTRVAEELKVSRPTLYGLLRKHRIRAGGPQTAAS